MTRKRRFHYKDKQHRDPAVKSIKKWSPANRGFYDRFRRWLREGGYSDSALNIYGCGARLALGWLDKPYWEIDPQADLDRVREYVQANYERESTRSGHMKGLAKLAEFLRERLHLPRLGNVIRWETYLNPLPGWLADDVRAYVIHSRRTWLPENQHTWTINLLSHLTLSLRWIAPRTSLESIADLTLAHWEEYVDHRLANGISPVSINGELGALLAFLRHLNDLGRPVHWRMLRLTPLKEAKRLPRDLPLGDLRRLRKQIVDEANAETSSKQREAVMDRVWFLLMLHCGLRTGEVRRLRLPDIDLESRRIRIEQSKGLKDRVVWISDEAFEALQAYLEVREQTSETHLFLFRHKPLSTSYCCARLHTYGRRCGVKATPHELRHSFATLMINARVPVEVVQRLLGHRHIDTTLQYARLYDNTVAEDYYQAMDEIEGRFVPETEPTDAPLDPSELLATINSLQATALTESQQEIVQSLRAGILALDTAPNIVDAPTTGLVPERTGV